jgi:two-component sensor histidine kinase
MRFLLSLLLLLGALLASYHAPAAPPRLAALRPRLATLPDSTQVDELRNVITSSAEAGDFAQARRALHLADSVAQASARPELLGSVALSAGYLANALGDFPHALASYQRALDLARRAGNVRRQVRALVRLGTTSAQAANYPAATRYLQQALALAQRQHLRSSEADTYSELANLADRQHQPAQAQAYNDRALAIYKADANWGQYYIGLLNQGIHLKNLGRLAEAETAYRQVLAYAEQQHDDFMQGFAHGNLAQVLLLAGRPAEAERYARLTLDWLRRVPSANGSHDMYTVLTGVAESRRDYAAALRYSRLATAYADTLRNDEQHRQLLQTEARYQSREQQTRIAQLDLTNRTKTRQLWALGLGLLLMTGLLTGNVLQFTTLRRQAAQLRLSNEQVREQAQRLTLLMKELHHRVKNNLAIISSLLYMQASRLQDAGAARAVREGQQRVDAMSLIHQRLYLTDHITAIDLPRYVAELAEGLQAAYGFDTEQFRLQLDVRQPTLDVEIAIPLGLILNEILTNAFKYAYHDVAQPALRLVLRPDGAGTLLLDVADNGRGFVPAARPTGSFGQQMIEVLSEQLGAILQVESQGGTRYQLRIPLVAGR